MCGLAFLYSERLASEALQQRMSLALDLLRHRGPNGSGSWAEAGTVIGHRRLSIIDIAGSRQPMADPSGRYVLSYNGEIYNFRDLRRTLSAHWQFTTAGDTEVLLAGLIVQGKAAFLPQLEGMWAFALWDTKETRLILGRDRVGKKPLYYFARGDEFGCASELPALRSLDTRSWEEDEDSSADYLRFGYYLPGFTAYKDRFEVLPGHVLTWRPGHKPQQCAYWRLEHRSFSGGHEKARELLRSTLISAVERRLVSDVEVGAFLSGGVDSSLIVAILAKELRHETKTFTIGFAQESYDERRFARAIAEHCQSEHHEEQLDTWNQDLLTKLVMEHIGQPFADSSILPTALVSQLASRHVKVVMSGDGSDEIFSGYQRYQARVLLRWYTRLPLSLRKRAEMLIRRLPEPMVHHSRSLLKKAHLFYDIVQRQRSERPYFAPVLYADSDFLHLAPALHGRGQKPPGIPDEVRENDLLEMMFADTLVYLPQDILLKVDRATMAYSVEARSPFLDKTVVELAFSLPMAWHRRGLRGKRLLADSFSGLLPSFIWKRRKQGFAVPVHQWFRGWLAIELRELLERCESPLNKSYVESMLAAHDRGTRDHGYRLWSIYIYLLWRTLQTGHAS